MNKRLDQFMKAEGLTSAKLAEILSVQPSSISHLLSGRNNPNFDFISKLLLMFPRLNPHWIINGQGDIYLDDKGATFEEKSTTGYENKDGDIFNSKPAEFATQIDVNQVDQLVNNVTHVEDLFSQKSAAAVIQQTVTDQREILPTNSGDVTPSISNNCAKIDVMPQRNVERVLLLYSDKTFEFFDHN